MNLPYSSWLAVAHLADNIACGTPIPCARVAAEQIIDIAMREIAKLNTVDLRKCVPGQILKSKHGNMYVYVYHRQSDEGKRFGEGSSVLYPHIIVRMGKEKRISITDDGHMLYSPDLRHNTDDDIVVILPII